jgi:hypothetical protein
MEKQTAVDWLFEEMKCMDIIIPKENSEKLLEVMFKAKEMEKQIMLEFADDYGTYLLKGGTMSAGTYNETFKSE